MGSHWHGATLPRSMLCSLRILHRTQAPPGGGPAGPARGHRCQCQCRPGRRVDAVGEDTATAGRGRGKHHPGPSTRVSQSGKRKLPMMPLKLARKLHARFTHSGKTRLIRSLKLLGGSIDTKFRLDLKFRVLPVMWRRLASELTLARYAEHHILVRSGIPILCLRRTVQTLCAS